MLKMQWRVHYLMYETKKILYSEPIPKKISKLVWIVSFLVTYWEKTQYTFSFDLCFFSLKQQSEINIIYEWKLTIIKFKYIKKIFKLLISSWRDGNVSG